MQALLGCTELARLPQLGLRTLYSSGIHSEELFGFDLEDDASIRVHGGRRVAIDPPGPAGSHLHGQHRQTPPQHAGVVATKLERELFNAGSHAYVLDGDNIRHGLCSDLGFSAAERTENIRRVGEVSKLFADAGTICITAFISPYRADRDRVRKILQDGDGEFIEVFLNTPLSVCETRDPKGLYARARAHQIADFTGISAPYESPLTPEIELCTDHLSVTESVTRIIDYLRRPSSRRPRGPGKE